MVNQEIARRNITQKDLDRVMKGKHKKIKLWPTFTIGFEIEVAAEGFGRELTDNADSYERFLAENEYEQEPLEDLLSENFLEYFTPEEIYERLDELFRLERKYGYPDPLVAGDLKGLYNIRRWAIEGDKAKVNNLLMAESLVDLIYKGDKFYIGVGDNGFSVGSYGFTDDEYGVIDVLIKKYEKTADRVPPEEFHADVRLVWEIISSHCTDEDVKSTEKLSLSNTPFAERCSKLNNYFFVDEKETTVTVIRGKYSVLQFSINSREIYKGSEIKKYVSASKISVFFDCIDFYKGDVKFSPEHVEEKLLESIRDDDIYNQRFQEEIDSLYHRWLDHQEE